MGSRYYKLRRNSITGKSKHPFIVFFLFGVLQAGFRLAKEIVAGKLKEGISSYLKIAL